MIWLFAPEGGPPIKAAAYFFGALSELRGVVTNVVRIRDALPDLGYHLPNAIGVCGASETEGHEWAKSPKMSCSALLDAYQYRAKRPAIHLSAQFFKGSRR